MNLSGCAIGVSRLRRTTVTVVTRPGESGGFADSSTARGEARSLPTAYSGVGSQKVSACARDSMPPATFLALKPFCSRMRVA